LRDETLLGAVAMICLTVLGVAYFVVIKQDSTVLTTLSSAIGWILGYTIGKRRRGRK